MSDSPDTLGVDARDLPKAASLNNTYPELAEAITGRRFTDFVVDGEIVAFDGDVTSFSRLQANAVNASDATFVSPEIVGEFGFNERTRAIKLRRARFPGLRNDTPAHKVRREKAGGR